MKKRSLLFGCVVFIILFSNLISAEVYDYGVGIGALGFQDDQSYFGTGFGASVSAYSGSLIVTATDASIAGANGMGVAFTRVYNSNVHLSNPISGHPGPEQMMKPSWLGHGWNGGMGRIIIPILKEDCYYFDGHGSCGIFGQNRDDFYKEMQFYLEEGDGSRQLMMDNAGSGLEVGDSDPYHTDLLFYGTQNQLGSYVFVLPDSSKVILYHYGDSAVPEKCLKYGGDVFIRIATDGTKYYYTHNVEFNGPYSDEPDGRECNSEADCDEGYHCETNKCLLDGKYKSYRQFNYPGVYLTKIKDPYGNRVEITYYNADSVNNIGDYCPNWIFPSGVSRSTGSPFIRKIVTKNANDIVIGRIDFEVTDPYSIEGRLDYITYRNWDGNLHQADYIYSGDLDLNPYYGWCETFDEITCDEDALLMEVGINKVNSEGTKYYEVIPDPIYGHEICSDDCLWPDCGFLCTDEVADNYCKNVAGYDGYKPGTKNCMGVGQYYFGCKAGDEEDPLLNCGYDWSNPGWIDRLTCYDSPTISDPITLFPSVKYNYSNLRTDPDSFFAINKIISPLGSETVYEYFYEPFQPCPTETTTSRKQVNSYTVKEYPDHEGFKYEYDYSVQSSVWNQCGPDETEPFSRRITNLRGPEDEDGDFVTTSVEYFSLNHLDLFFNDYVSGKEVVSKVYDGFSTGDPKKEERTTYAKKEKGIILNHAYFGPSYCVSSCNDIAGTPMYCVGNRCLTAEGVPWGGAKGYTSYPTGKLTTINENGEKIYAQKTTEVTRYLAPIESINFGEIDSYNLNENGFTFFTVDDSNAPDDAIKTKIAYYYWDNLDFAGNEDLYKYFVHLPSNISTWSCLVDGGGDCNNGGDALSKKKFNVYNENGKLNNVSVWDDSGLTVSGQEWITTNFEHDSFGNVDKVIFEKMGPGDREYNMRYWYGVALRSEWVDVDGVILQKDYSYYPTYKLMNQVDENGNEYNYTYDELGRLTEVYLPGDEEEYPSSMITYHDPEESTPPENRDIYVEVSQKDDGEIYFNSVENHYDTLGRKKTTKQVDTTGSNYIRIDTLYDDNEGLVEAVSKPYADPIDFMGKINPFFDLSNFEGPVKERVDAILYTEYLEYDALNRLREVRTAGATETVTNEYGPNWIRVYDENDTYVTSYTDAYGRTVKVEQIIDGSLENTIFEYDKLGNLLKTIDAKGRESTSTYNSLGQIKNSSDTNAGEVNFTYYLNGNIWRSNDWENTIWYVYDDLDRVDRIYIIKNGAPDSDYQLVKEYFYDHCSNGMGKLCAVTSYSEDGKSGYTTISYEYDAKGNIVTFFQTIDDKLYEINYTYFDGGNLKKVTYPDGNLVLYEYDAIGRLEKVGLDENQDDIIDNDEVIEDIQAYNIEGTIATLKYGNDVVTQYSYNSRDWLQSIDVNNEVAEDIFTVSYAYDAVGNLEYEFADVGLTDTIATYNYDDIYRLKGVIDAGKYGFDLGYIYDTVGNRLSKTIGGETTAYNVAGDNVNFDINNQVKSSDLFTYDYSDTGNLISKTNLGGVPLALAFDGLDDYVEVLPDDVYKPTEKITMESWIYIDDFVNFGEHFEIMNAKTYRHMRFFVEQDGRRLGWVQLFEGGNTKDVYQTNNLPIELNTWYHVAATYDGSIMKLYVNGVEVGSKAFSGILARNSESLGFGRFYQNDTIPVQYSKGQIRDVRIYNIDIGQDNIQIDMNYGGWNPNTLGNLVGWWKFDEGEGTVVQDSSIISGGNDGTIYGGERWVTGDVEYNYNYANQLIKVNFSDGNCEGYVYNPNGMRVKKVSTRAGLATYYVYDVFGNVILEETEIYSESNCEPEPMPVEGICQNRIIEGIEYCDHYVMGGNGFSDECSDFPYPTEVGCPGNYLSGTMRCLSDCSDKDITNCNDPTNDIKETGEECAAYQELRCVDVPGGWCVQVEGTNGMYTDCDCAFWRLDPLQEYKGNCDCTQTATCRAQGGVCVDVKSNDLDTCECVYGGCMDPLGRGCAEGYRFYCTDAITHGGEILQTGTYEVIKGCFSATDCCLVPWYPSYKPITELPDPNVPGEPWD